MDISIIMREYAPSYIVFCLLNVFQQVIELHPRNIFQAAAQAGGVEEEENAFHPIPPDSLVKEVFSVKDRNIVHPAPMEDGMIVPDSKVWARVQATVR